MVIAMGEEGLWTRVLAKKLGSFATYGSVDPDSTTAPGQVTLDEVVYRYRWSAMDSSTKVYGVLGDPVAHSMSPVLFNHWFAEANINAVYLPLRVRRDSDTVSSFLDGCRMRPWLDVGGFSVTVPHKAQALQWVAGGADPMSSWIGAVNTLVFEEDEVRGFNTDCSAAVLSMMDALGCSREDCGGLPVHVLGAGGAALAVIHGLYELGCNTTLFGRSPDKTQSLASKYGARAASWEDRIGGHSQVLINCTSIGMWPEVDASPMPKDSLTGYRLVFDVVYNPLKTRLLSDAAEMGCATLSGVDMFVRQAAKQLELWTGLWPDLEKARELISCAIRDRSKGTHDKRK
jgi:3-dehydroquinate dehydratase/shikimate dehydrogenase